MAGYQVTLLLLVVFWLVEFHAQVFHRASQVVVLFDAAVFPVLMLQGAVLGGDGIGLGVIVLQVVVALG